MTALDRLTPAGRLRARLVELDRLADAVQADRAATLEQLRRIGYANRSAHRTVVPAGIDAGTVRAWGRSNGWPDLGTRGRLPADLITAYVTAH